MFDIPDERHFTNNFIDWREVSSLFVYGDDEKQQIVKHITTILEEFEKHLMELDKSDISMYTGLAGIGYFYYRLSKVNSALIGHEFTHHAKIKVKQLFDQCLLQCDLTRLKKNVSVFTSCIGVLLLGALSSPNTLLKVRNPSGTSNNEYNCLRCVLDAHLHTLDVGSGMPDEALYGRVGYLAAILTAKQCGLSIPADVVVKVTNAVLHSGTNGAKNTELTDYYRKQLEKYHPNALPLPPLMYEWHEKAYLGAAHGFAGILLTLLKVRKHFPGAISSDDMQSLVLPTVDWFSRLQMSSGNWPSSLKKHMDDDRLVHWCHGATGAVPLLLAVHEVTGNTEYMQRALRAGECIWHRGLLHKGCGLCHGSAGSGYAHLALYQASRDEKHLYRAVKFAEWCTDYTRHRTRIPDRPLSLFEGLAGTLCYLVDMLDPDGAQFPLLN